MEYLFPSIMVALSVAACAVYAWRGDWGHASYWLCGAGITATVTFWLR